MLGKRKRIYLQFKLLLVDEHASYIHGKITENLLATTTKKGDELG